MAMDKEVVRYDKLLKVENEKLQKEVDELRAEKEAFQAGMKAGERSVD